MIRKRNLAIVFFLAFSLGCAGMFSTTQKPQETAVFTYEGVALALNTAKAFIKGQEISGGLKGAELDLTIAKWEKARLLFLQAGDTLKEVINSPSPVDRNVKLQQYNQMLQAAGQMAGQLSTKGGWK